MEGAYAGCEAVIRPYRQGSETMLPLTPAQERILQERCSVRLEASPSRPWTGMIVSRCHQARLGGSTMVAEVAQAGVPAHAYCIVAWEGRIPLEACGAIESHSSHCGVGGPGSWGPVVSKTVAKREKLQKVCHGFHFGEARPMTRSAVIASPAREPMKRPTSAKFVMAPPSNPLTTFLSREDPRFRHSRAGLCCDLSWPRVGSLAPAEDFSSPPSRQDQATRLDSHLTTHVHRGLGMPVLIMYLVFTCLPRSSGPLPTIA